MIRYKIVLELLSVSPFGLKSNSITSLSGFVNGFSSIANLNWNASLVQFCLLNSHKLNDMVFQLRAYNNNDKTEYIHQLSRKFH